MYATVLQGITTRPAWCDSGRARTCDPLVKSQLLCQLSYGVGVCMRLRNIRHRRDVHKRVPRVER